MGGRATRHDVGILGTRGDPSTGCDCGRTKTKRLVDWRRRADSSAEETAAAAAAAAASKVIRDRPERKTSFKGIRTTIVYR